MSTRSVFASPNGKAHVPNFSYLDSAAGQGLCSVEEAFHGTLTTCYMRVSGFGGHDVITAYGTTYKLFTTTEGEQVVAVAHNQLYSPASFPTSLYSISQIQLAPGVSCDVSSNERPQLHVHTRVFNLSLVNGLFAIPYELVSASDSRFWSCPHVIVSPDGHYEPVNTPLWSLVDILPLPRHVKIHVMCPNMFASELERTN